MDALQRAEADLREAKARLNVQLNDKREAEKRVAQHHAPIIDAARVSVAKAQTAYDAALSAQTPDHPWTGKTVIGERMARGWSSEKIAYRGVVFTYRPGDDLGRGHTYTRPEPGQAFVRLLKSDGTPGAKTEILTPKHKLAGEQS